jgi:CDP-glucose 4,6-dehydratase
MMIEKTFWKGRKVFITGHTGFKGSWLSLWLNQLGATVTGYALESPTVPALFDDAGVDAVLQNSVYGDIRDAGKFTKAMQDARPEIIIHMAAQPLVRDSYIDPVATYSTNVMGTVNMFEAVRQISTAKAVLNITTDKCYENDDRVVGYCEHDSIGGYDPYSSSKGCSELVSSAYRRSFLQEAGVAVATARAGNVIGGGDWAKDRIVPDAMRAFINNDKLIVRNPFSTRPWQHVLEPLSGYLMLCQQLIEQPHNFSQSWNFGPNDEDAQPVSMLADIMVKSWGNEASWELDDGNNHLHEANYLKLNCANARKRLKWHPIWNLKQALEETVKWYKARHNKLDMYEFTLKQIESYQQEQRIYEPAV